MTVPRVGALVLAIAGATLAPGSSGTRTSMPVQAGRAVALRANLVHETAQRDEDVVRATVNYEAVAGKSLSVVGSAFTLPVHESCGAIARNEPTCLRSPTRSKFSGRPAAILLLRRCRELQPAPCWPRGSSSETAGGSSQSPVRAPVRLSRSPRQVRVAAVPRRVVRISGAVNLSERTRPEYELGADGYMYGFWHVDDDSWLSDLVYGRERWLVIRYELVRERGDTKADSDVRVTARLTDGTGARTPLTRGGGRAVHQTQDSRTRRSLSRQPSCRWRRSLTPTENDTLPPACGR